MRPHMRGYRAALGEPPVAHGTPKGLFPRVRPCVRRQICRLAECFRARVTPVIVINTWLNG